MSHTLQQVESVFASAALFASLSPRQQKRLARGATTRLYAPGATILREGDTSLALYVVLTGRVQVQRRSNARADPIREIGPGGIFGELGVIDDRPRSASVMAIEPTECALLSIRDIRRNAGIALGLLPVLAQRIRDTGKSSASNSLPADVGWLEDLE